MRRTQSSDIELFSNNTFTTFKDSILHFPTFSINSRTVEVTTIHLARLLYVVLYELLLSV